MKIKPLPWRETTTRGLAYKYAFNDSYCLKLKYDKTIRSFTYILDFRKGNRMEILYEGKVLNNALAIAQDHFDILIRNFIDEK